jgi:hypothetical protein
LFFSISRRNNKRRQRIITESKANLRGWDPLLGSRPKREGIIAESLGMTLRREGFLFYFGFRRGN